MSYFSALNSPLLQIRSAGLCLFVTVYIGLFLVASLILFSPLLRGGRPQEGRAGGGGGGGTYDRTSGAPLGGDLGDRDREEDVWLNALFLNKSFGGGGGGGGGSERPRGLRWPPTAAPGHRLDCAELQEVTDLEFVAAGWTKAVYRGKFRGEDIAIKTVNLNGHDLQLCQRRSPAPTLAACYRRAAAKLLKELILLTELAHGNLVKVIGSCVPDAVGPVVVATELGDPLDIVQLLQLSWEHRLKLAMGVAQILHHLAHSSLGSLAMNDLRRQQFVLVGETLKLSDVDDMGISEPTCRTDKDCIIYSSHNKTFVERVTCQHGFCEGYNERLNIWRAGQHFIRQFLPLRAPSSLEPHVQTLLDAYSRANSWDSEQILIATEKLVQQYKSGEYAKDETGDYKWMADSTMVGSDYNCSSLESSHSCIYKISRISQAASICDNDRLCNAVVIKPTKNITRHYLAILKNGVSKPETRKGYVLLVKRR